MGFFNQDEGKLVFIYPQEIALSSTDDESDVSNILEDEERRLVLTATESYSRTDSSVVSTHPVSSNTSHSDHYRFNGARVEFKGVISPQVLTLFDAISGTELPPIQDYISRIRKIMRMLLVDSTQGNKRTYPLVTIHLPDGNTVRNCAITSFKISRDVKVSDGYRVEVSAQELLIANTDFSVTPKNDTVTEASDNKTDAPVEKVLESGAAPELVPLP